MRMPEWWSEMGWDFRFCVVFLIVYTPFMFYFAAQP